MGKRQRKDHLFYQISRRVYMKQQQKNMQSQAQIEVTEKSTQTKEAANMKNINEFMRQLTEKRTLEEQQNPDLKNLPIEDPIICNGVADVIAQPSTETENENDNIM